jgi:hypothetical protein
MIFGNAFAGHREADIVIAGSSTRCENNSDAVIRRSQSSRQVEEAE